ncbi:MAG: hypothetical protein KJ065_08835 [Anaerolineae bacterium]|nr:hypothetical protein [Anaerolineae bacterium]
MIKHLPIIIVILLLAPSCGQITSTATPVPSTTPDAAENPQTQPVQPDEPTKWVETQIGDFDIGAWIPANWEADTTNGLTVVEHMGSIGSGQPSSGITIYIFVPDISEFIPDTEASDNLAYEVLDHASGSPEHMQGVEISPTKAFNWGTHDAAYYLYAYGQGEHEGFHGMVLAVTHGREIIVINVMSPRTESARIRSVIPPILQGLSINHEHLSTSFPDALPDPLVFPDLVEQS